MEGGYFEQQRHPINRLIEWAWAGPGHPVARRLEEGDEVAGFRVLHVPGPLAGPRRLLARVRPRAGARRRPQQHGRRDRHARPAASRSAIFTPDPARNRESARRLAALEPALVCFGHGPPLRDTRKFVEFVAALPT